MKDISDFIERALGAAAEERERLIQAALTDSGPDVVYELAGRVDRFTRTDARQAAQFAALALDVAHRLDAPPLLALAERATAHALRAQGQYASSLAHYDQAARLFEGAGQAREAARTRLGQIGSLMYLGRNAEALELADQARAVFRRQRERRNLATVNLNTGIVYHRLDRYREALRYLDRARRGYLALGDRLGAATTDVNRGNALTQLGSFRAALQAFERARPLFVEQGMDAWGAMTDGNIGFLHFVQGHYNAAVRRLLAARETFVRLGVDKDLAISDLDLAEVYLALNQFDEVLKLCDEARTTFEAVGMPYEAGRAQVNSALAWLRRDEPDKALPLLASAEKAFLADANAVGAATVALYRAQTLQRLGHVAEAWTAVLRARAAFEANHAATSLGYANAVAGHIALSLDLIDEAQAAFSQALALGHKLRHMGLLYQATYGLGRLYSPTEPATARAYYLEAMTYLERTRAELQAEDLRLGFLDDKLQVYDDLVWLTMEADRADIRPAFNLVERARSRALLDLLGGALDIRLKVADPTNAEAVSRLQLLREELNGYYSLLARREGDTSPRASEVETELRAAIHRRETQVNRLVRQLQVAHHDGLGLRDTQAVTLEETQALLAPHETLVTYYAMRGEVLAFAVQRDRLEVYRGLASTSQIEDLVGRLHSHMFQFSYGDAHTTRHREQLKRTATLQLRSLYNLLIRPMADSLAGQRLTIIPHNVLHYLPFHAFDDGEGALIERQEVVYTASASVLKLCRARLPQATGAPLLLGISSESLPYVNVELDAIARVFPQAAVFLNETATLDRLRQASATSRIIHLASHAVFRPESPLFSSLQLADGWLTVHDIYNLDLQADLVTLSACNTGLSALAPGDELLGLARGFFYAGTPSLLVSLWAVNDGSTARFMELFYRRLYQGETKAAALRGAILAMQVEYPHPYHWAPFVLLGNGS